MFYRLKGPKLSKMGQKRPSFFGGRMVTDGEYVAYGVKTEGKVGMVREPSDGSSAVETLTQGPEIAPSPVVDWSRTVGICPTAVSISSRGAGKIGLNRFSAPRWLAAASMMGIFRRTATG